MNFRFLLIITLVLCTNYAFAQKTDKPEKLKEEGELLKLEEGWTKKVGIGLDFSQLAFINPKVGAGENRIGLGGVANFLATYKKGKWVSDNVASLQFGAQRLGSKSNFFTKTIDELNLASRLGYKVAPKWYAALDFSLRSQLTPTYNGNRLVAIDSEPNDRAIAKFFAPANVMFIPGIDFRPNDKFSILMSPFTARFIIVADDNIAALGIHGNPWRSATDFDNVDAQFGASIKAKYEDKFLKDRITFNTTLLLFSNYLNNPQNIDVEWQTNTAVNIWKGLSLNLATSLYYDDDVLVQVDRDNDPLTGPNGYESLGKRISFTELLLLKYSFVF